MKPGTVTIHIIPPCPSGPVATRMDDSPLTEEEHARSAKFRSAADSIRWAHYRSALRNILSARLEIPPRKVPITISPYGKPQLAAPFEHLHFNLSHSETLALVASSTDGPVGIDLEPLTRARDLLNYQRSFCHPQEITRLRSVPRTHLAELLLEIWSYKESLLKAVGTGLYHPPEALRIQPGPAARKTMTATSDTPLPGIDQQRLHRLHHADLTEYMATLSAPPSIRRIEIIRFETSTSRR